MNQHTVEYMVWAKLPTRRILAASVAQLAEAIRADLDPTGRCLVEVDESTGIATIDDSRTIPLYAATVTGPAVGPRRSTVRRSLMAEGVAAYPPSPLLLARNRRTAVTR